MDTFTVKFTSEKLARFNTELAKHDNPEDTFVFEGREWLVAYARYLSEYLKGKFLADKIMGRPEEYEGKEE